MQNANVITKAGTTHARPRASFACAAAVSAYASDMVVAWVRPVVEFTRCGMLTIDGGGGSDG